MVQNGSADKRQALYEAIWEWLPGVAAGILPLLIYLLIAGLSYDSNATAKHNAMGLPAHLLILAIANSSVSLLTSFNRLYRGKPNARKRDGRIPDVLILLTLLALAYVIVLYGWIENGGRSYWAVFLASLGLLASLTISLYMEFIIALLAEKALPKPRGRHKVEADPSRNDIK